MDKLKTILLIASLAFAITSILKLVSVNGLSLNQNQSDLCIPNLNTNKSTDVLCQHFNTGNRNMTNMTLNKNLSLASPSNESFESSLNKTLQGFRDLFRNS